MSERPVHMLDIRRDFPSPQFEKIVPDPGMWRNGMAVRMPNHLGDAVMALPRSASSAKSFLRAVRSTASRRPGSGRFTTRCRSSTGLCRLSAFTAAGAARS